MRLVGAHSPVTIGNVGGQLEGISMVAQEDGSKKRMFNHIKRLMWKQEQRNTSIKFLNGSGIIVNDEQEVERLWAICFAQMVK